MGYKWKPSKSQKRAFAERMQDPKEQLAYLQSKDERDKKRRQGSKFDYSTAGGNYVPTKAQHDFCLRNVDFFVTREQINARNMVLSAYACNDKTHHDNIHVVNELIRSNPNL